MITQYLLEDLVWFAI